jgi:cellobiose-specific phosphotransferase system component IIA
MIRIVTRGRFLKMDSIMECMNMTAYGGEAKSKAMLAIQRAREGDFDGAAAGPGREQ